jgi:hypothetical protein
MCKRQRPKYIPASEHVIGAETVASSGASPATLIVAPVEAEKIKAPAALV